MLHQSPFEFLVCPDADSKWWVISSFVQLHCSAAEIYRHKPLRNSSVRVKIQPWPRGVLSPPLTHSALTGVSGGWSAQCESNGISTPLSRTENGNWRLWQGFKEAALMGKTNAPWALSESCFEGKPSLVQPVWSGRSYNYCSKSLWWLSKEISFHHLHFIFMEL